jgi:hypothetical protein
VCDKTTTLRNQRRQLLLSLLLSLSTLALQTLKWTKPNKWLKTVGLKRLKSGFSPLPLYLLGPRAVFTKFHPENVESCRAGQIEISSLGHPLKCGSLQGGGGGGKFWFSYLPGSISGGWDLVQRSGHPLPCH